MAIKDSKNAAFVVNIQCSKVRILLQLHVGFDI